MWKIIAVHNGAAELIDETDNREDAEYLRSEYQMAFGPGWWVTIRKNRKQTQSYCPNVASDGSVAVRDF